MQKLKANKHLSCLTRTAIRLLCWILFLILFQCKQQDSTPPPLKKPHSIEEYASGEVHGDPCVIKTAKAILKSGLKYPNIEYGEDGPAGGAILSRDIWAGSTLLRFKYRGEREEGWGLFNGGLTPNEHPLSSNWLQGSVISTLKLDPKKLNFKDPRAGGTLYGELTCFTPSDSFQDIASSSLSKLNKAVEENILKRFPSSTHAQRRKELKDINFLEILIYRLDNPSKQVAVYLPLKSSRAQETNLMYQPIVCQKEYDPDAVTRVLPFQCAFSLRVGTDAVLRVRTYQQMLPYLPRFRSLVKEKLEKYIQPQSH